MKVDHNRVYWFMVLNATFNNILVDYIDGENRWPVSSHWQTLLHNVVSSNLALNGIRTHNFSGDRHWLHRYHDLDGPFKF